MKFSEIVHELMAGKRVRKTNWDDITAYLKYDAECNMFDFYMTTDGHIYTTQSYTSLELTSKDLTSDLWEVLE